LANSTFLIKISHSSKKLGFDRIVGSFNAPDIVRSYCGFDNEPNNFDELFAFHQNFTFEENLIRLVESTNNIVPTRIKFDVNINNRHANIMNSPTRAISFVKSDDYDDLLNDLNARTKAHEDCILVAALIPTPKTRGLIIEYLIAGEDISIRKELINHLLNKTEIPRLVTRDSLGDYTKIYSNYHTETDIKTKIMICTSAPKGYNLDKILEFLSEDNTVFMLFFIGIDYETRVIKTKLISMFQQTLLENSLIQHHWAGRNSRGVTQFNGEAVKRIIMNEANDIDAVKAKGFLQKIIEM
jgi:hypothetical protein